MKRKRSMTDRALLALREQVNLVNWWETEEGENFGKGFMRSQRNDQVGTGGIGDRLGEIENYKLDRASTYWVTGDMQQLIEHAANSMPGQALKLEDLPSPFGFVWFENIIEQLDAHAQPISWRAMAWMPAENVSVVGTDTIHQAGLHITYYTDVFQHSADEFPEEPLSQYGGKAKEEHRRDWINAGHPRLMLLHETGWVFGQDYRGRDRDDNINAQIDDATRQRILNDAEFWTRRFVAATWTIIGQKVAAKSHPHIPKTDYRSAARSLSVPPDIIFVDLRKVVRPKGEVDEDSATGEVNWNHRWIVDGHWRNQYLPSTGGHRLQWIHPFVKGPEDRPLIIKDRVHRVVR